MLGGNASSLAFVSALRASDDRVAAHMVSIAQTPLGTVLDTARQNLTLSLAGLLDWMDANFPPQDERAFVTPVRDIELLARTDWSVNAPAQLSDQNVLNIEDLPDEIADALAHPPEPLVQCAVCRRLCVRDHFAWKDRQLCAWDYHRQVFGKRGPWRSQPIEERHYGSLPAPAYVVPFLLEEEGADVIMAIAQIDEALAQKTVNTVIEADPARAYMAVRTPDGYTLVRER